MNILNVNTAGRPKSATRRHLELIIAAFVFIVAVIGKFALFWAAYSLTTTDHIVAGAAFFFAAIMVDANVEFRDD